MIGVEKLHDTLVFRRRTLVLSEHLVSLLPENASVLDVGCGDGTIDKLLVNCRPDISITGADVLVRPHALIPVHAFDGVKLPFANASFDVVMFVDVLHHAIDPIQLLRDACRVSRRFLVIKDHLCESLLDYQTLRLMDWVGNSAHGVALPYNYFSRHEWDMAFSNVGLRIEHWKSELTLYPRPATWLFDRGLHYASRLEKNVL